MNRHAKASSVASDQSGALTRSHSKLALIPLLVALLALVFAASAEAAHFQRPFKETFGSAAQPSFEWSTAVAVERDSGNVLVADFFAGTITRYHADGTPAPFTALGSNTIDGKEVNGKPCAEEPASCDKTPQNEIEIHFAESTSIAIDESGGPTDGDIYVTQPFNGLVDIFAPDGGYLGQLTGPSFEEGFGYPCGVAVDGTGSVYVTAQSSIDKFVPTGNPVVNTDFLKNFGRPPGGRTLCAIAAGAGPTAGSIFGISNGGNGGNQAFQFDKETGELKHIFAEGKTAIGGIAVDPNTGTVLLPSGTNDREVAEYEANGGSEPERVSRLLTDSRVGGFAVNSASEVIIGEGITNPHVLVFGAPAVVPSLTVNPASNVIGTRANLSGTVNPTGVAVTECYFEYGTTTAYGSKETCEGSIPTDSSSHPVHANLSGLEPNGRPYHFRLVVTNPNGTEESADQTFVTENTVVTEAATSLGATTATLNGTVRPEGSEYSECFFEYGLLTSASYEKTVPCNPSASGISADFSPHAVKAALTGLEVGSTYRYRLVATNSFGNVKGDELTFGTLGLPRISEVRASGADQSSFNLEARINPSGFGTSYRFEWGPTIAYGNFAPAEFEPFIGAGTDPVLAKARISGLPAHSVFHYRVVATNGRGTVQSPDHVAETLNSCGLPEGRCFELVSRSEAGPVAIPGEFSSSAEVHYQAATGGPGALAYPVESGYPEATKGAEVLYRSLRGPSGWESTQLSTPIVALNEQAGVESGSGKTKWFSNDLSCGFAESNQPLTADPGTRLVLENGGSNLYRINSDGSYTAVSSLAPENSQGSLGSYNYDVVGASQDCGKVVFSSQFHYPGITGGGAEPLYEWDEGTLRNVGVVPGPSGDVPVKATAGTGTNFQNVISEDGSRVFFSATRKTSSNPAEIGQTAVFVRENGAVTRDLSLSQTATPADGATYQWATPDGSKVFFTANAGLTADSNSEGTDLYEYDLETEELSDRSVTQAEGGAQVAGFLGAAEDGSRVYFASRNQLIPGSGSSRAQNVKADTYSIYSESDGDLRYVGAFSGTQFDFGLVVIARQQDWTSQVSPDGRYLLFQSALNITGYDSGGSLEAYLYDAKAGSQGLVCVSCRQDGLPSLAPVGDANVFRYSLLPRGQELSNYLHAPQFLTMREGEPQVFFSSPDALAPDAVAGQNNIYEWTHSQLFRLTGAPAGTQDFPTPAQYAVFGGASTDGSDVYVTTPETLNWEDGDDRISAYDARVGGGSPEPPPPPTPCNATAEGSCQGAGEAAPVAPGAASAAFNGPGHPPQTQAKKKKAHKKKSKKHAKKKGSSKARHANSNRRAGK